MARLGANHYGKSRVRLSRITRRGSQHDFDEWTVQVILTGDFENSFTKAENDRVLPTDTMKNTVYSIARATKAESIEEFAQELGNYLLGHHSQVARASIEVTARNWERMVTDVGPEPTTFRLAGPELQTVAAVGEKGQPWSVISGIEGLTILKTTHSAFTGFVKDRLTTLKPTTDRILGTCATAKWTYQPGATQLYDQARMRIIAALLKEFAAHRSMSVQHTLFDMGKAALAAAPEIATITLSMPNLHHLLADLTPFGQDNPNHIFVPIDEPHGAIEATVER